VLTQLQAKYPNVVGEYLELELSKSKDISKVMDPINAPFKTFMVSKGMKVIDTNEEESADEDGFEHLSDNRLGSAAFVSLCQAFANPKKGVKPSMLGHEEVKQESAPKAQAPKADPK